MHRNWYHSSLSKYYNVISGVGTVLMFTSLHFKDKMENSNMDLPKTAMELLVAYFPFLWTTFTVVIWKKKTSFTKYRYLHLHKNINIRKYKYQPLGSESFPSDSQLLDNCNNIYSSPDFTWNEKLFCSCAAHLVQ